MAKANRLKLAASLIEAEIGVVEKAIDTEATTGHYGKACGWQKYIEGLEKALSYLKVIEGNKNDSVQ